VSRRPHRVVGKRERELPRSGKVGSVGGRRTAAYVDRIIGRLDHLLSLGVVEGKFPEAKEKVNRLGLARVASGRTRRKYPQQNRPLVKF
jgi:hypothetical protein